VTNKITPKTNTEVNPTDAQSDTN